MNQIKHMTLDDYDRVMKFIQVVFPDDAEILEKVIFRAPFKRPENFAYVEESGRIVSFMGVAHYTVRLGDSKVKAGEIEAVGTHPDFRGRGLASKLMKYWIRYMKREGMTLSWLYGIPNFYQQFGFEYALPFHKYCYMTIVPEQLVNLEQKHRIEPMLSDDLAEVDSIYNSCSRFNFGSVVRSLDYWKYRFESTNFGPHRWMVVKEGNAVVGYLWLTESDLEITVRESGAVNEEVCQSMAAYMYELSKLHPKVRTIGLLGPHTSPLACYFYRKGARKACANEVYPGTWGGMVRIVDLAKAIDALSSMLSRRLAASHLFDHSGMYTITSELGSVGLEISHGQVRTVSPGTKKAQEIRIPGSVLTQSIMGYKGIQERISEVELENEHLALLLTVLFPAGHPWMGDLEMSEELV